MNFTPESLTLISIGVGIFATLISLRLSMREWRKEHREDIQNMDAKWDTNIKNMETKWDTNLKNMVESIRAEVKVIHAEVKESDKRWYLLLEKMHMIDKDVNNLKAKN